MLKRAKIVSKKMLAICILVISLLLVSVTVLPTQTEATTDDATIIAETTKEGMKYGRMVGGQPGMVCGAAVGVQVGTIKALFADNMNPNVDEPQEHYAERLERDIRDSVNATETLATTCKEWEDFSKLLFYRKAEYGAVQLYDSGERTYEDEYVFEHTNVARATNTWAWQVGHEFVGNLNMMSGVGTELDGNYSDMEARLKMEHTDSHTPDFDAISDPNNVYDAAACYLLGQEPFYYTNRTMDTIFQVSREVTVRFKDTNGNFLDFKYKKDSGAWSDAVQSKDFSVDKGEIEEFDVVTPSDQHTILAEQYITDSSGDRLTTKDKEVYNLGYAMKPYADIHRPALAFFQYHYNEGYQFEALRIWGDPFGGDDTWTDISKTGYVLPSEKSAYWEMLGAPSPHRVNLDRLLDDMRFLQKNATQTLQECSNVAEAQFVQYVDQGGGNFIPIDAAFTDPRQLENMTALEIRAVFTARMRAYHDNLEQKNYEYDGPINISGKSFQDLRCTGYIENDNNSLIYGGPDNPHVFRPFVSIDSIKLKIGMNEFNQRSFAFGLGKAKNESTTELNSSTIKSQYIKLKEGHILNISEITIEGESVDSIDLNITTLKAVLTNYSSAQGPLRPDEDTGDKILGWFQKYWLALMVAGFGIAIGFAATDPEVKMIGGILIVVGIFIYMILFAYNEWWTQQNWFSWVWWNLRWKIQLWVVS